MLRGIFIFKLSLHLVHVSLEEASIVVHLPGGLCIHKQLSHRISWDSSIYSSHGVQRYHRVLHESDLQNFHQVLKHVCFDIVIWALKRSCDT